MRDIITKKETLMTLLARTTGVVMVSVLALGAGLGMAATLQKVDSVALPNDEVEISLSFDEAPPRPQAFTIEKPARISLDFPGTSSALNSKYQSLGAGNARSMTVVQAKDRTRAIINLNELTAYSTRVEGDVLYIRVGRSQVQAQDSSAVAVKAPLATKEEKKIVAVDFHRSIQGDGQVVIDLSSTSIPVDIQQEGSKIIAKFMGANLSEQLRRRLDVTDFATPVTYIDTSYENGNTVMVLQALPEFEYLAYQTDNQYTISVKPVTAAEAAKKKKDTFMFSGEKLSLNFQDIEVRSVLQLIADFTSMNLVASDTVSGRITLRLQNVPWDQALELILKTKGLDKRVVGNVMLVGPADEIATRERLELQSNTQTESLAPLRTEFMQINYAKAADLAGLISGEGKLLSARGSASVDARTNTLIVSDTVKKLEEVRDVVARLDIPVRQVMIEARIVLATTGFSKQLGVRWGNVGYHQGSDSMVISGGSRTSIFDVTKSTVSVDPVTGLATRKITVTNPDDLVVDMGVDDKNATSFAIGLIQGGQLLTAELSAMQSDGHGEIVSTPKVLTADKQKARISAGKMWGYQEASSSGAATLKFINAELSLEVTPSITPDGRINLDLMVNDDSLGEVISSVPTINTNRITTQVLVNDGETVVLGGIFKNTTNNTTFKTPFLGDIPYLGRLFRKTVKLDDKQELLIFVTPKLAQQAALVQ